MLHASHLAGAVTALALLAFDSAARAADELDVPIDAPQDAVMASPQAVEEMANWAKRAFAGEPTPAGKQTVRVMVRRQDHSVLHFGQSCIGTPIRIGQQRFEHGLGTHANSELLLSLPSGAKRFKAFAGIDNNPDTGGTRGSAQFFVELGGKEIFRTPTIKGGHAPAPVDVELPAGTRELVLKVDATADGVSYDQADWADARVVFEDGRVAWVDAERQAILFSELPFSFVYDGQPSEALLPGWKFEKVSAGQPRRVVHTVSWTDMRTQLQVSAVATAFERYPAVEWVLYFENRGTRETPLLENIQALNTRLRTGYIRTPVILHQLAGDACGERSYLPMESIIEPDRAAVTFAPAGGRSSNGTFPFFNVQYGDEGLITAIGWSGQWAASLQRAGTGPTRLQAGMEKLRLRLQPGEKIRSPRILVMAWKGDRQNAHNRFRRLMLFEYVPRLRGRPLQLPVALQCFDRYAGTRPEWGTEVGQLRAARAARDLGCDTLWLDAAWFEGGFPNGVGNWFCKPKSFPNGLIPVSDACRQAGLNFMVWFEPERVAPGTQIAREHPEFVIGGDRGGLFKLNDPAARRWMTDLLSQRIAEFGLATYRNDFNIDPLEFWRRDEPAEGQGRTEIRYVEGHYALWDELLARHPGLSIDNCASGGRRIDLETCRRSVPLWRSDTGCSPGHADWDQVQTCGLSQYVPLSCSCSWSAEAYALRSAATAGAICQFDYLNERFSMAEARTALAEIKANRKFWYGDFYPLTRCTLSPDAWMAYQFHRPDLHAGIVYAFRRGECPYPVLQTGLRALEPAARYSVEIIDETRSRRCEVLTGAKLLADFELRAPNRGASLLLRYEKVAQ